MFCALSVLLCSVQYCAALFCTGLFCCGALPQPLFVHFINFLQLKTQVSSLCSVLGAVLCSQLPPYRSVSVCSTYYVQLLPSVEYQIHRMNASQAGRQAYVHRGRRQAEPVSSSSSSSANAGTDNVSVFVYLLHWCVYLCFVHSVRSLGTFRWLVRSMCAKQRQQHSTTYTHYQNSHTYTYTHTCVSGLAALSLLISFRS